MDRQHTVDMADKTPEQTVTAKQLQEMEAIDKGHRAAGHALASMGRAISRFAGENPELDNRSLMDKLEATLHLYLSVHESQQRVKGVIDTLPDEYKELQDEFKRAVEDKKRRQGK